MKIIRLYVLNVFIFCLVNVDDCVCYCLYFGIVDYVEFKSFNFFLMICLWIYKFFYFCLMSKGGMILQNDVRGNRFFF